MLQGGVIDGVVVADASLWALLSDRVTVRRYEPAVNLWRDALASPDGTKLAGGGAGAGAGAAAAAVQGSCMKQKPRSSPGTWMQSCNLDRSTGADL